MGAPSNQKQSLTVRGSKNPLMNVFIIEVLLLCSLVVAPVFQWLGVTVLSFWVGFSMLSAIAAIAGVYCLIVASLRVQTCQMLVGVATAVASIAVAIAIVGIPVASITVHEIVRYGVIAGGGAVVVLLCIVTSSIRRGARGPGGVSLGPALYLVVSCVLVVLALGLYYCGIWAVAIVLSGK